MAKILVVEDNTEYCKIIRDCLLLEHHNVEVSYDGSSAREVLFAGQFDLLIMDWQLPGMSGVDLCREFRARGGKAPVLMLTGRNAAYDKAMALDGGADDYIVKPADPIELAARVRALLRRSSPATDNVLRAGSIELNPQTFTVTKAGQKVELLPREFALLEFLMRHAGRVYSSEELLQRVWETGAEVTADAVRVCVRRIRTKLDEDGKPSIIRSIYSVGYTVDKDG